MTKLSKSANTKSAKLNQIYWFGKRFCVLAVILIMFLFCAVHSAQARCVAHKPIVNVSFKATSPQYYSKPQAEVIEQCRPKSTDMTTGCTHHKLSYLYQYKGRSQKYYNQICYKVTRIDMQIFYKEGDFYVYIDDRYSPQSCAYKAIKKHEDMHVAIDLTVNKKEISRYIQQCITGGETITSSNVGQRVAQCVRQAFEADQKIREEHNQQIDDDENNQPYRLMSCKDW